MVDPHHLDRVEQALHEQVEVGKGEGLARIDRGAVGNQLLAIRRAEHLPALLPLLDRVARVGRFWWGGGTGYSSA